MKLMAHSKLHTTLHKIWLSHIWSWGRYDRDCVTDGFEMKLVWLELSERRAPLSVDVKRSLFKEGIIILPPVALIALDQ